jgi:hypothetical protein
VISGHLLVEAPPGGLFLVMMVPAPGAGVARASPAALLPGNGVLEVGSACGPATRRPRALAIPDLHQMPEPVARFVGGGLIPVVTIGNRNRLDVDGQR